MSLVEKGRGILVVWVSNIYTAVFMDNIILSMRFEGCIIFDWVIRFEIRYGISIWINRYVKYFRRSILAQCTY